MKKVSLVLFGVFLVLPLFGMAAVMTYRSIIFEREIGGHLKRAADANSVLLAKQELGTALSNIEKCGMTEGYTSILYTTPDEDIGFWYNNIKACWTQIDVLPENAPPSEKDLVLMKLRQTLLDHVNGHEAVTVPSGISKYPYNVMFAIFDLFALFLAAIGSILVIGVCFGESF